ncbi:MAG: short-chain dehydrogenase [Pseudoalteromonas sp.]|uniref:SDR family oxidoreductase n=1 Tax=Pseudoalteromonas sp. TaxID=53249 RepID=UPI000C93FA54|nr:SDR family oxidoreductase [Pseudoalteromonas sp.]MAD02181.1 short-chain dehydrogenase [Pseudoalteromonas sp.]|tara:strand:+ start:29304 stop:30041 length:738 start_codon:yes stop_codon:yes gene_type:complete
MKNIVIIGATSAMATEVAKLYALESANICLLGRNQEKLLSLKQDLIARGARSAQSKTFDVTDFNSHEDLINTLFDDLSSIDVFLLAHGSLPNQNNGQSDIKLVMKEIDINALSYVSLLTAIANKMEKQKSGSIVAITSVAGDRGRESNYIYGSAKGMVSIFLQGLAQRLEKSNVHVLDIKPGFVDTPMTAEFDKGFLWAQPRDVAKIIKSRVEKKSNFSYTPWFWWLIMTIIKSIPTSLFKRMKL